MWGSSLSLLLNSHDFSRFAETPLDDLVRDYLNALTKDPPNKIYDFHAFDRLLSDISGILDRCLAHRREYHDLISQVIIQASSLSLFKSQVDYLERLELGISLGDQRSSAITWIQKLREIEKIYQGDAENIFSSAETPKMAEGFATLSRGAKKVAEVSYETEAQRVELVRRKWEAHRQNQDLLIESYGQKGSSLCFEDRAERILRIMKEDLNEAWNKYEAVRKGFNKILGISLPRVNLNVKEPLDEFLFHIREMIDRFEIQRQGEVEFGRVISLRFGSIINSDRTSVIPIVPQFGPSLNSNRIDFRFSGTAVNDIGQAVQYAMFWPRARLTSMAASLVLKDKPQTLEVSLIRTSISVKFRGESVNVEQKIGIDRPSFTLSNVGVLGSAGQPDYYSGEALRNIDANTIGTILLHEIYYGGKRMELAWDDIGDILLHCNVVMPSGS